MRVSRLLLGGWGDVVEDVRRLQVGLRALGGTCACGQGGAHLAGTCSCCDHAERAGCIDCGALIESLHAKVEELFDASLRFLPLVESMVAQSDSSSDVGTWVRDVRHDIAHVDTLFRHIETAAGQYRSGCASSHFEDLKTLVADLAIRTQSTHAALMRLADLHVKG